MDELTQTERELKRAADAERRTREKLREQTETRVLLMRTGSAAGLSYDRIATATGLSKTQIARVLRG